MLYLTFELATSLYVLLNSVGCTVVFVVFHLRGIEASPPAAISTLHLTHIRVASQASDRERNVFYLTHRQSSLQVIGSKSQLYIFRSGLESVRCARVQRRPAECRGLRTRTSGSSSASWASRRSCGARSTRAARLPSARATLPPRCRRCRPPPLPPPPPRRPHRSTCPPPAAPSRRSGRHPPCAPP